MAPGQGVSAPTISVVVPTHDTRALTLACLAHLGAARGPWEIVVVDDGSTDGTASAIAAVHPEVRVLRFERARGFSCAANAGLQATRGDLLWLLNSDTEVPPDAHVRLAAAFAVQPRLGAAGAELVNLDGSAQWSGGPAPGPAWLFAMASGLPPLLRPLRGRTRAAHAAAYPRRVDWVTGAALALRRSAWEQVGPLDEGCRFYAQDLDLCLRLRRQGYEIALVSGLRVRHHGGATISQRSGAWNGAHPELLWWDLARCLERAEGPAAGRRARWALRWGTRLRLAARGVRALTLPVARRDEWQRGSASFQRALLALDGNDHA